MSMELVVEAVLLLQWVGEEVVPVANRFMASQSMASQLTIIQLMDSQPMDSPSTVSQLMVRTCMGSQFTALLSEGVGQEARLAATLLK